MSTTPALNFNLFTHYVKGLIFSGSVLEKETVKQMKGEWKLIFNRLMTDARNFEKQLHKGLGETHAATEEDTNAEIFRLIYRICQYEGDKWTRFVEHLNKWEE